MKNLFKIALTALMLLSVESYAQESIIPEIKYADLEKYIDLAKQNYTKIKILDAKTESIKTAIPIAAVSYLDPFSGSYFYRPTGKTVIDPLNPYNVNGFQFGINLNLGAYLQKPFQAKKAKYDYKVAQLEQKDNEIQVTLEVKKRYYDYIQQIAALKIFTQSAQDSKSVAESLRNRFEKGEITLEAYNQSRIIQTNAFTSKIQAEANYLRAKDLLEEIVGQKLSDIK
ncbi:hypothetical protein DHW03_05225 [Pedobacter yonginense]|uniref:TolC family protein n=1 Tax=Pedobacter yonginense TaxID=651869 RepID=A0A317EVI8_9SPHI|nr:TolC family protein [Pedobacter yonginense]PWS29226.1 hypothetical protein DHW03_05225 [Pedobacter yonginense]